MLNFKLDRGDRERSRFWQAKIRYRRYVYALAGVALSPFLAIALVDYPVDPYGIFNTPALPGFNLLKPVMDEQTRAFKAAEIIRLKSQRIILGSSRTIMGVNEAHEAFRDS